MPTRLSTKEGSDEDIFNIFQQAQANIASHKKNVVQLHKLHSQAAQHTESTAKGIRLVGEKAFNKAFEDAVYKVLPLKKGTTVADRIVKFVGLFVKFTVEKTTEELERQERGEEDDSTASRFIEFLIRTLLKGFTSKDKIVRYRSVQFVAEIVTSLGELDEELYSTLRHSILERIQDKESAVRVQAVIAVGKLQKGEDPQTVSADEAALVDVLCDVLQYDTSADVRRAALLNTPTTERTLPSIISRVRDIDDAVRKLVFQHSLPQIPHPRVLTIVQRERILRTGLGDREIAVKDAARSLALKWVEALDSDLIKFLETFDLVGGDVAEQALFAVFEVKPDLFDSVKFEGTYWNSLTPEKTFLARVFTDYCVKLKDEARLEAALPEVTALAFYIQNAYNRLIEQSRTRDAENDENRNPFDTTARRNGDQDASWEAEQLDLEFIVGELFRIAVNVDYGDEIGRRKMFSLVREMIGQSGLPDGLVPGCLDVLRKLAPGERDFIRLVVEVVQVMRDPGVDMDEEVPVVDDETQIGDTPVKRQKLFQAPEEKSAEEQAKMAEIDMRCLSLCTAMLERVMSTFDENPTLDGILAELIIPAVKSKESAIRERGMIALGLCCLIHRKMAINSFGLFINQVERASPTLKLKALQIVFDMLTMYERDLCPPRPDSEEVKQIVDFLLGVLANAETEAIQATTALGLSKLMISGVLTQERVLQSLVMVYFSPETIGNQQLRQCLSIALPIYGCSSSPNQCRLQRVIIPSLLILDEVYNELEGEQDMVTPLQILGTLVDWTDSQKVYQPVNNMQSNVYEEVHVDLAIDMLTSIFDGQRKLYIQMLNKLSFPDEVDENKLRKLKYLISSYKMNRAFPDATSKTSFERFSKSLEKRYADVFSGMSEEDARKMESLKDLFDFLDELVPEDVNAPVDGRKKGRRAR
ncbi:hypothetical protein M408DRAFT_70480 [Serendipita vermifera MAFF 305830]|uniref:Nuclear condensin complex subunit 3 C-terminal domain-containing protein n=1 Tax=Serendipita vermifera MAFF 305830 TaxID=933852 RepID=A0A0C3B934_SERVB|nr:hypothetical protein M408DRAFT_70480 [Serendipita vermifera MAFF 305830]